MINKNPAALKFFMAVLLSSMAVIIAAICFSLFRVDPKYSRLLALLMFIALSFANVGVYAGLRDRKNEMVASIPNKVGLIGSLVISLLTLVIMIIAAINTVL